MGTRRLETQLRPPESAHTSIGGSTTSALNSATVTLRPTTMPKSRSNGSDDVAMTATPVIAVSADTKNARARARRGDFDRGTRRVTALPLLDEAQQDQ